MNKFIPKLGESCVFQGTRVIVTAIGEAFALVRTPFHDKEFSLQISELSSLRTTAENERENSINEALDILGHDYKDDSVLKMLNNLFDAGYSKKQVKPLSRSYAVQEIGITDVNYCFMVEQCFIRQGAE